MKNLLLFAFLTLSINILQAQLKYDGVSMAILEQAVDDKRVAGDCYGLKIKTISHNGLLPLKGINISIVGDDNKFPFTTNKAAETFIITAKDKLDILVDAAKAGYIGGSVSNIELEKGKLTTLIIYVSQKHDQPFNNGPAVKKPVIYFYPEKEMDLNIILKPQGEISFSYPAYNKGWNATVTPNGDIRIGDKTYPYLFWEGNLAQKKTVSDFKSGFVIEKTQVVAFLEEKLAFMGLNQREMTDFITFWAPQMEQHEFNFVHFVCAKDYATEIAELEMSVKPDSEIRINIFFAPVNADFITPVQRLQQFKRSGFTVVEWGGAVLNEMP
jgi:hypothetical protein